MMENNDLIQTWEEGNKKLFAGEKLTENMIEQYLKPRITKSSFPFLFNLVYYFLWQVATLGLLVADIIGYSSNPTMLSALIPMLVLTIGFLVFGYYCFLKYRAIRNYSENLVHLLKEQLKFIRIHYETLLVIFSFSVIILIFALGALVDNQDGTFRINNPLFFTEICIGVFLFTYGMLKLSGILSTRPLKIYLNDLQNSVLEGTQQLEMRKKRYFWIGIVLILIFIALLILGIAKSAGRL